MGKRRQRASKMGSRLTGLDFMGIGASWEPAVSDAAVAESVLRYLEDRRVLYAAADVEVADHCVASVLDIRENLTDLLRQGGIDETLTASLRAMRAACRRFLERLRVDPNSNRFEIIDRYRYENRGVLGLHDWILNQAIGELRGIFGVHIALLADRYGLEIEDELASILPSEPID